MLILEPVASLFCNFPFPHLHLKQVLKNHLGPCPLSLASAPPPPHPSALPSLGIHSLRVARHVPQVICCAFHEHPLIKWKINLRLETIILVWLGMDKTLGTWMDTLTAAFQCSCLGSLTHGLLKWSLGKTRDPTRQGWIT